MWKWIFGTFSALLLVLFVIGSVAPKEDKPRSESTKAAGTEARTPSEKSGAKQESRQPYRDGQLTAKAMRDELLRRDFDKDWWIGGRCNPSAGSCTLTLLTWSLLESSCPYDDAIGVSAEIFHSLFKHPRLNTLRLRYMSDESRKDVYGRTTTARQPLVTIGMTRKVWQRVNYDEFYSADLPQIAPTFTKHPCD